MTHHTPTTIALLLTLAFAITATVSESAHAVTVNFQGSTHDSTYIRSGIPSTSADNDPDSENILGINGSESLRGLFEFDLNSIIPMDGSTLVINSVSLTMTSRGSNSGGSPITQVLSEYGFNFVESAATWNDPAGDGSDGTAGGTIGSLITSVGIANPTALSDGSMVTWASNPAFVGSVEGALNDDGFLRMIVTQSSTPSGFMRYYDEDEGLNAPLLFLDFTVVPPVVPEPSSFLLLGLGALGFVRHTQRRRRRA